MKKLTHLDYDPLMLHFVHYISFSHLKWFDERACIVRGMKAPLSAFGEVVDLADSNSKSKKYRIAFDLVSVDLTWMHTELSYDGFVVVQKPTIEEACMFSTASIYSICRPLHVFSRLAKNGSREELAVNHYIAK